MIKLIKHKLLIVAITTSVILHCIGIYAFVKSDILNLRFLSKNTLFAKLVSQYTEKTDSQYKNSNTNQQNNKTQKEDEQHDLPSTIKNEGDNTQKSSQDAHISTSDSPQKIRLEIPVLNEKDIRGFHRYQLKIDTDLTTHQKPVDSGIALLRYNREELHYNIYWVGIHVGNAKLSARRHLTDMVIQSEVHSNKFISNFYRVEDYAKSTLVNGKPHRFRIKQIEGKYKSDKETIFDYTEGQIIFIDYLKNKQMGHNVKEGVYWDVISGFYYLRSMPVFDTNKIFVDVFDSNKFIKVQVVILGRERIETLRGEDIETIKTKIVIHTEGLFKKVGDIYVWLSDDVNRIPLKVETKVPVGKVTAELSKIETD